MSDTYLSNIYDLISKLYSLWKKKYECTREDDHTYFGKAYKDALDLMKHGGEVYLPSSLWKPISKSLHSFLRTNPP